MKWNTWLNIVFGVIILSAVFYTCSKDREIEKLKADLYKVYYDKDSLVAVKDAQIVREQESIKNLRNELFQTTEKYNKTVKRVEALIAIKSKTEIDSVLVPYVVKDTSGRKAFADSLMANCVDVINYYEENTVLIGNEADIKTPWYSINAEVEKKGIRINKIEIVDSQYVALTTFKGGFFKKNTEGKRKFYLPKQTKVEIKHKNPHIKTVGTDAYYYQKGSKYGKGFLHGGVLTTAAFILLLTLSP